MAVWGGLGQAATVAQLVGADIGGLISMIMQAAVTARQNKKDCEQLARRVFMIAELLPHLQLQDPEVMQRPEVRRPLAGLEETLREAHQLVTSCQGRSAAYRFVMARRQSDKFRDVQSRIDSYLIVFPFISYIGITRRLDRIYDILLPCPSAGPQSRPQDMTQEVILHGDGGEELTLTELAAATDNFAPGTRNSTGGFSNVYIARLPDGREVAIKRITMDSQHGKKDFWTEISILSLIHHKHITRLLGWCVVAKEEKRPLSLWKMNMVGKEDGLIVYEYMNNRTLDDHLHGPSSSSSPVRTSWKMRIEILLGVSRAIEYLHTQLSIIHRDIKPSNILLDTSWAPCLSDFSSSVTRMHCTDANVGTWGYIDPEYMTTGCVKPTSDVYSFGVVVLEALTGKKPEFTSEEEDSDTGCLIPMSLTCFALPIIEAGELGKLMDKSLAPELTLKQLEAVDLVACIAARCVQMQGKDRPAMSDVVANLEAALELVRGDE